MTPRQRLALALVALAVIIGLSPLPDMLALGLVLIIAAIAVPLTYSKEN